jgi:3-hydroxybutyryl-CoA dehydratase
MHKAGDFAELKKVITEEDIYLFAGITGDRNPLHTSHDYASKTRFGERIAHGMLTAGLISAALGMRLPGPGSVSLSQNLEFLAPVKVGDEITARVEVTEVISEKRLRMRTQCFNQRSELVLDGEAVVAPPPSRPKKSTGNQKKKEDDK